MSPDHGLSPDELEKVKADSAGYARKFLEHWIEVLQKDIRDAKRAKERRQDREEGFGGYLGSQELDDMEEDVGEESAELLEEYKGYLSQLESGELDPEKLQELAIKGFRLR